MGPDTGTLPDSDRSVSTMSTRLSNDEPLYDGSGDLDELQRRRSHARRFIATRANQGQNFTARGILVGLGVGLVICFSNMYFGLQTGWVSGMSMPASLIGFAFFKTLSKHLDLPFTPVENVLVQTVAGSMGTMPLGCGFVGVMPALNYMLKPDEGGPILLSRWKLIIWALGLCFFGVVFAVPLRRQVIIREKLKFPSGTATALMIGVLHGEETDTEHSTTQAAYNLTTHDTSEGGNVDIEERQTWQQKSWKSRVNLLVVCFLISGTLTLAMYFFPVLRNLPLFGTALAQNWLWTVNPSLAYVGQGMIMGPSTTTHMLLGAVFGWGILSPLAKSKGWAPGFVDDWETGSKGWIVWISLAIMLVDAVLSLAHLVLRPVYLHGPTYFTDLSSKLYNGDWKGMLKIGSTAPADDYAPLAGGESVSTAFEDNDVGSDNRYKDLPEPDAPHEHLVNNHTVWIGLILSIFACVVGVRISFGDLVPIYATIIAVFMALLLSIMGVRALGETDLNPVSGISKLAQLFFAVIIPQSTKNSVLINLIAGAISESGALQAGDLMQDLKTGHLLGAAPNAQFWGQIIGSAVGAVASALIYRLYTDVYEVPGNLFEVPTGYVWIFTARLVTGKGLPYMALQWALGAAVVFAVITVVRIKGAGSNWHPYVPGGIAVAVGMYNVPSFTIARAIGGFVTWYWQSYKRHEETPLVIMASGLILGEGVVSILNLFLASMDVPHL